MRARVISTLLPRVSVKSSNFVRKGSGSLERSLHNDAVSAAAATVTEARASPLPEDRPPLTDLIGRRHNYLRISLTERCNLRCQYCMPAEGVPLSARSALLSRGELTQLVRAFAALGVTKLRLTGGEPTLRADLADIIQELSEIPGIGWIGMTTNGLVLTRRLPAYQRAGLNALNISLDSLRPDRYEKMSRRPGLQKVLAGVDLALQLGYRPVKINVVLMKGFNDDEIVDFVDYTRSRAVEVRFIEFMPFGGNRWDDERLVPHRQAVRTLTDAYPDAMPCLPRPNDTARVWQVPGFEGRVGFISSMTNNFCSTCNRLRLTADGNLKVCLFGNAEVSLRDALRQGADVTQLEGLIRTALNNKKPQHAALSTSDSLTAKLSVARTLYSNNTVGTAGDSTAKPAASRPSYLATTWSSKDASVSLSSKDSIEGQTSKDSVRISSSIRNFTFPENFTSYDCGTLKSEHFSVASDLLRKYSAIPIPKRNSVWAKIPPPVLPHALQLAYGHAISLRSFSSESGLTHFDKEGRARMVDVGDKTVTARRAAATCSLRVSGRLLRLLKDANLPKGDAITVAQLAGVMGAKRTSDLIPMCHPLMLECVRVNIELPKGECADGGDIALHCEVSCNARTGAEMEALTGAAIAALALYDMCKAVDKTMKISNLRVVHKSGGRSGEWPRPEPHVKVRDLDTSKRTGETYAPTTIMYF